MGESDRLQIRMPRDREQKLNRVMDLVEANNQAQAIDHALDCAIQLHGLLNTEVEEMQERADELSGDGLSLAIYPKVRD